MRTKDQAELIRVIAAVIRKDSSFLVCQRPLHKRHGGLWEFPGGKLQDGESLFEATRRELAEELQIDVISTGKSLFEAVDPGSKFLIEFVEVEIQGDPKAIEHQEVRWCSQAELATLSLAPADTKFVRERLRGQACS